MSNPGTHVIVGALGEVGAALVQTLGSFHTTVGIDTRGEHPDEVMERVNPDALVFLHIAIPFTSTFAETVREYEAVFAADVVIVHSTVPPGMSAANGWLFSPVTGRHPNLAQSLRTFSKPVAGVAGMRWGGRLREHTPEQVRALMVDDLEVADIPAYDGGDDSTSVEASKIVDLAWFGMEVRFEKEIHRLCQERGWNFAEVYTHATARYRRGYRDMEENWVGRPLLIHDPSPHIGGHCVLQGSRLLRDDFVRDLLEPLSPPEVDWDMQW